MTINDIPPGLTPGQARTLKARTTRARQALERKAAELRAAGYVVASPREHAALLEVSGGAAGEHGANPSWIRGFQAGIGAVAELSRDLADS